MDRFLLSYSARWLENELARWLAAGSPSATVLRDVIASPQRTAGVTDSWFERVLVRLLDHPEIPEVVLQHQVNAEGRRFKIDIAVPVILLGIEAHGRSFHFGRGKEDADNVRDPDEFVRLLVKAVHARARLMGIDLAAWHQAPCSRSDRRLHRKLAHNADFRRSIMRFQRG